MTEFRSRRTLFRVALQLARVPIWVCLSFPFAWTPRTCFGLVFLPIAILDLIWIAMYRPSVVKVGGDSLLILARSRVGGRDEVEIWFEELRLVSDAGRGRMEVLWLSARDSEPRRFRVYLGPRVLEDCLDRVGQQVLAAQEHREEIGIVVFDEMQGLRSLRREVESIEVPGLMYEVSEACVKGNRLWASTHEYQRDVERLRDTEDVAVLRWGDRVVFSSDAEPIGEWIRWPDGSAGIEFLDGVRLFVEKSPEESFPIEEHGLRTTVHRHRINSGDTERRAIGTCERTIQQVGGKRSVLRFHEPVPAYQAIALLLAGKLSWLL